MDNVFRGQFRIRTLDVLMLNVRFLDKKRTRSANFFSSIDSLRYFFEYLVDLLSSTKLYCVNVTNIDICRNKFDEWDRNNLSSILDAHLIGTKKTRHNIRKVLEKYSHVYFRNSKWSWTTLIPNVYPPLSVFIFLHSSSRILHCRQMILTIELINVLNAHPAMVLFGLEND